MIGQILFWTLTYAFQQGMTSRMYLNTNTYHGSFVIYIHDGSSLGSARILAREPGVFRSSARSSQAFWKLALDRSIIFLAWIFWMAKKAKLWILQTSSLHIFGRK